MKCKGLPRFETALFRLLLFRHLKTENFACDYSRYIHIQPHSGLENLLVLQSPLTFVRGYSDYALSGLGWNVAVQKEIVWSGAKLIRLNCPKG